MGKKILLVDDEGDIRTISKLALEEEGFVVDEAVDGLDALEKVKTGDYDAILLDARMPKMDGFQTCQILKSQSDTAPIPIIFLTASTQAADEEKGLALGACGYIKKPFDVFTLAQEIKTILGW